MKLILDFEYLQLPLDDEPKNQTVFNTNNVPNIGDTVFWRVKDGDYPYKVQDKSFTYENGLLVKIVCYLEKS
jgi:hypothetical protein